jgi:3-hydroxyisobutyrate dehydrogenase
MYEQPEVAEILLRSDGVRVQPALGDPLRVPPRPVPTRNGGDDARGLWSYDPFMGELGIVGVGSMGAQMWHRLRERSCDAVVMDVAPSAVQALVTEGATAAADVADLASRCDTILLSLPTSADVRAVATGPRGIADGARPGTLVVDMTSGAPSASRAIAQDLATTGVRYVDCGVSGGIGGARAGTLKAMVGGDVADVRDAGPALDLLCGRVWHCGPVGAGHLVKTLLNQSNQTKLMVELEALTVAAKAGLDAELVADVLELPVWAHWLFGPAAREPIGFSLALACKDYDIALGVAAEEGVGVPLAALAQQLARITLGEAGPRADLIDSVAVRERAAGTRIERPEGATP